MQKKQEKKGGMKFKPINQFDGVYSPWKGNLIFESSGRFYILKCDRQVGRSRIYRIKDKAGNVWTRYSIVQIAELLEFQGISKFEYRSLEFKMELISSVIVVSQEYKDDFVAVRAKDSKEGNLKYKFYPRDIPRQYPLLAEFEKTRFADRRASMKLLKYYLAMSL